MSPSRVFIFFVLAAACFGQARDNARAGGVD
jgi:hypothetical protein